MSTDSVLLALKARLADQFLDTLLSMSLEERRAIVDRFNEMHLPAPEEQTASASPRRMQGNPQDCNGYYHHPEHNEDPTCKKQDPPCQPVPAPSPESSQAECEHCKGKGQVRYYHGDFDTCPTCHGTGKAAPPKAPEGRKPYILVKEAHDGIVALVHGREHEHVEIVQPLTPAQVGWRRR